jgi:hypothetical protein
MMSAVNDVEHMDIRKQIDENMSKLREFLFGKSEEVKLSQEELQSMELIKKKAVRIRTDLLEKAKATERPNLRVIFNENPEGTLLD